MTPISRATWALLGLAVLASGACVWALLDLGRAPPSTASVPVAGHRLFVQAADDGLSVLTDRSSFRVLPDLTIEERQWPTGVRLRSVDSAATLGDVSLFLVRPASMGPAGCGCRHAHMHGSMPPNLLLRVDRESVTFVPVDRTAGPLLGVRARGAHLELWRLSPSSVTSTPAPDPELQARGIEEHWLTTSMPLEAVEGVVFEHNEPLLVVTHKLAHWLVDTKGALRPMPGGALSLWTPSFLRPPSSSPWREPFVDEEMSVFAFVPGSSALAFTAGATPTDIYPLIVTHGDEPGIFASTAASGEHVEVKHIRRRVWVRGSSAERWQPLAISTSAADFVAYPVAGGFIALSEPPPESFLGGYSRDDDEGGEAVAFDAHLMRTDRAGTSSVATLTGASQGVWVALTALLLGSLCLVPLVVVRLRRRFAIDEDDLGPRRLLAGGAGRGGEHQLRTGHGRRRYVPVGFSARRVRARGGAHAHRRGQRAPAHRRRRCVCRRPARESRRHAKWRPVAGGPSRAVGSGRRAVPHWTRRCTGAGAQYRPAFQLRVGAAGGRAFGGRGVPIRPPSPPSVFLAK